MSTVKSTVSPHREEEHQVTLDLCRLQSEQTHQHRRLAVALSACTQFLKTAHLAAQSCETFLVTPGFARSSRFRFQIKIVLAEGTRSIGGGIPAFLRGNPAAILLLSAQQPFHNHHGPWRAERLQLAPGFGEFMPEGSKPFARERAFLADAAPALRRRPKTTELHEVMRCGFLVSGIPARAGAC